MPLPPGHRLGRFEILSLVGAGGMGEVYRARDTRLVRDVALKILAGAVHADEAARRRFEREARTVAALSDPNIVTIHDVGAEGEVSYLVTEMLEGETLREHLLAGPVTVAAALDIAIQLTGGLSAAHAAGIVHRDIKPQNIFLTRGGIVKVLDFGISRLAPRPSIDSDTLTIPATANTRRGDIVGTPGYMAPEQARGQDVDARSDVFACGCVLHEMLAGRSPFGRATPMDTMAAILSAPPPALPPAAAVPPLVDRVIARCLEKDPGRRFQSAHDLRFVLEAARDGTFSEHGAGATRARAFPAAIAWLAAAALAGAAAMAVVAFRSRGQADTNPTVQATVIVPASARPITAAIAPDGQWVTYVGASDGRYDLYVQSLSGGVPANLTRGTAVPVQNRTIVGGLDVLSDGSGIAVAGRPTPDGLFRVPGIWIVPAPSGGPPQRVTDRYAAVRWSPDGRRVAGIVANPVVGDAIAVAAVDGQDERILVSAGGGVHLHQIAWGHDGRHVYYARTMEPRHWLSEVYRVAVDGGPPEAIVTGGGTALFPAPTPDGRALIYAGDPSGEGLNLWWRPFDGSPERRLTIGAGEYTEPFIARSGRHLVCLARRRRGELIQVPVDGDTVPGAFSGAGAGDSDPAVSAGSDRIFVTSSRGGRRKIWSLDESGQSPVPLTSGEYADGRPAISPDGRAVAFISNRGGRRGVWLVSAEGGTPRLLVNAEVIDYVSWAPDSRRVVYAAPAGTHGSSALWIAGTGGGEPPVQIPGAGGRVPAWSPTGDVIATLRSSGEQPVLHFISPAGVDVRPSLAIDQVGVPTAIAWSPDGSRLAFINLSGRAFAEAWIARLADRAFRKVSDQPAPTEFDGVAWSRDGHSILIGRTEYETEVLLIRGLP